MRELRPRLAARCFECHGAAKAKGDVDLERFASLGDLRREPRLWQEALVLVEAGDMPPPEAPPLDAAERASLVAELRGALAEVARAEAGDPGPVLLRRLSNAEYGYTVRDLTGVASLDPARELPVDGAAGEGFSNVGQALPMSPMLLAKYLDAAREIAAHAVLLPDGIAFSAHTSARDQSEERLAAIRALYRRFTDPGGATQVNLQGIVFDTNAGGRLPIERYLEAALDMRDAPRSEARVQAVARERQLSAKYLGILLAALHAEDRTSLLAPLRDAWPRLRAEDLPRIVGDLAAAQSQLFRFQSVGHLGKAGGPRAWQEAQEPVATSRELRLALPSEARDEIAIRVLRRELLGGASASELALENLRLVTPSGETLPHAELRSLAAARTEARERAIAATSTVLSLADELLRSPHTAASIDELAARAHVEPQALRAWFACAGIASVEPLRPERCLTQRVPAELLPPGVAAWGLPETPSISANATAQDLHVPGLLRARSVALHPSPTQRVGVAWRAPGDGAYRVQVALFDAHTTCGNGVSWRFELRRAGCALALAEGATQGDARANVSIAEPLALRARDELVLLVSPREREHTCDLTAVDFELERPSDGARWSLGGDCAESLLAANPHADRAGTPDIWWLFAEEEPRAAFVPPADSSLARWLASADGGERASLAAELQRALLAAEALPESTPDGALVRSLRSLHGPLVMLPSAAAALPSGEPLRLRANEELLLRWPAELAAGGEVHLRAALVEPQVPGAVLSCELAFEEEPRSPGLPTFPLIASEDLETRARVRAACDELRSLFPAALCYERIVPVDEVVTLVTQHREDEPLVRLMLDEAEAAELERLWSELRFVSRDPLVQVDVFEQLWQYATQDADPSAFEPLREPIRARAEAFRAEQRAAEPRQLEALLAFAARAFRRPLAPEERTELRELYVCLRTEELGHDEALRAVLARVLVAPRFLYKVEEPPDGVEPGPLDAHALAARLSYFLWSGPPDVRLRELASSGALREEDALLGEARRMLRDPKSARLALEFGCGWLHLRDFDGAVEKSERHYPSFTKLRAAMQEEVVQLFAELFRRDGSVLELLDADHALLNDVLAAHYGIPGVVGEEWRRVDGVRAHGRGGILALAATLAAQSGASRTSPILRGNWVSEVLLGEKLPKPPPGVPVLPTDEGESELSVRELTAKHSADPACARCHERIDAFGFSLEGYDAIGRRRERDAAGRLLDLRATTRDGFALDGLGGLRAYLLGARRADFLRQLARKLLGYALGRAVRLGDEPLLDEMLERSEREGFRFGALVETIVTSPQFTRIRGREAAHDR
ncbi:MAG: DUF1592 domain-containing protein [Planctomycetes bacterium]|nr:DUF1592 domain-containing protein [Planctomycetota bacterium]